jgi:Acetyltransferases
MNLKTRFFKNADATPVADLVAKTLMTTNIHDYSKEYLQNDIDRLNENFFIQKAQQTHFYVFLNDKTIIGVGAIGPYWDSKTEFSLFNIFVDPDYQGLGVGRLIIKTLENDAYFKVATRVEIPASITALKFYKKMGYYPKITNVPDSEGLFRLEKYPKS